MLPGLCSTQIRNSESSLIELLYPFSAMMDNGAGDLQSQDFLGIVSTVLATKDFNIKLPDCSEDHHIAMSETVSPGEGWEDWNGGVLMTNLFLCAHRDVPSQDYSLSRLSFVRSKYDISHRRRASIYPPLPKSLKHSLIGNKLNLLRTPRKPSPVFRHRYVQKSRLRERLLVGSNCSEYRSFPWLDDDIKHMVKLSSVLVQLGYHKYSTTNTAELRTSQALKQKPKNTPKTEERSIK